MKKIDIFRIHIRPQGGLNRADVSFAYCLKNSVLGMGWGVPSDGSAPLPWDDYDAKAVSVHGEKELSRVRYFHREVQPNHLIWTRDANGWYYLGRVMSSWEYLESDGCKDADIFNVVRCEIQRIEKPDDVPGKVVASFRPSRTIQRILDTEVNRYSQLLWNRLADVFIYDPEKPKIDNLFSFLDSESIEDVVFIYLQCQGWLVLPNSRKVDTMGYEYILIHGGSSETAVAQVKTGGSQLDASDWEGMGQVFLFQSNGRYKGKGSNTVDCIDPDDLLQFMLEKRKLMPGVVKKWIEYAED